MELCRNDVATVQAEIGDPTVIADGLDDILRREMGTVIDAVEEVAFLAGDGG